MSNITRYASSDYPNFADDFIAFAERIYADSPRWVPPFVRGQRAFLARNHPYFLHADGEFFLWKRAGETVARVFLAVNRRYNEHHRVRAAFFESFECVDETEVADTVVAWMEAWARDQGMDRLIGPTLSGGAGGMGLLIDGFDREPPMTMMRWNPPSYRRILESRGFEKLVDLNCLTLKPGEVELPAKVARLAEIVKKRGRFEARRFRSKKEILPYVDGLKDMYNINFDSRIQNYPLCDEELELVKEELLEVADPELITLLLYDGKLVGYLFGFADYTETLRRNRGRLGPIQLARLFLAARRGGGTRLILNGMGILPEYQRLGGNALLYAEIAALLRTRAFDELEMVQIAEDTTLMLKDAFTLGGEITKKHRIFVRKC
jgi:GNAT superfamily N-acetyltransferase